VRRRFLLWPEAGIFLLILAFLPESATFYDFLWRGKFVGREMKGVVVLGIGLAEICVLYFVRSLFMWVKIFFAKNCCFGIFACKRLF
jgi:hypothetical protein